MCGKRTERLAAREGGSDCPRQQGTENEVEKSTQRLGKRVAMCDLAEELEKNDKEVETGQLQ